MDTNNKPILVFPNTMIVHIIVRNQQASIDSIQNLIIEKKLPLLDIKTKESKDSKFISMRCKINFLDEASYYDLYASLDTQKEVLVKL